MRKFFGIPGVAGLLFSLSALALDAADQDALDDTTKLLGNDAALQEFAKGNPDATGALAQVQKLTGGNVRQQAEVNNISSDIFKDLVRKNQGDSAAIQLQLQQALKDPKAFMNGLSPEQQNRIRTLASEIEKKSPPAGGTKP